MPTTPFLRYCGLLVVIAAAPIPLLLTAHVIERSDCVWWFLSYLAVALVASRLESPKALPSRGWARKGPWALRRNAADGEGR